MQQLYPKALGLCNNFCNILLALILKISVLLKFSNHKNAQTGNNQHKNLLILFFQQLWKC